MQDESYEEDKDSQNIGKTTHSSHSLADLEQSQTTQWNPKVLTAVLLALNNPQQAEGFPLNLIRARGVVGINRLPQISMNAPKTGGDNNWEPMDDLSKSSSWSGSPPSWAGSWSDKSAALRAWSNARTLTNKLGFKVLDQDGSGSISAVEIRNFLTTVGETVTDEEVNEMVSQADVDGDGQIDYGEFVKMMTDLGGWSAARTLTHVLGFRVFDEDGSGSISASEFRQVMSNLGEKLTDTEVDEMIRQADVDGDGEIDYDEFVKMMMSAYDYGLSSAKMPYE